MHEARTPEPTKTKEPTRFPDLYPMWIALFVDVLGYSILIPLFPFISEHFPGANALVVSLLLSTNAVFGFIFGPLLSSLSDKYGRKPLLMISLAGTMAGFLVFAFAPRIEFLFLSRAIDGIFGGVYPITRAVIGDIVPIKQRSKQMANMGVVHIIASLVGPAAGGILAERTGTILAPGLLATLAALGSLAIAAVVFKETLPIKTGTFQGKSIVDTSPPGATQMPMSGKANQNGETPISKNKVALYILAQWGAHAMYFTIWVTLGSLYLSEHLFLNSEQIGYLMMLSGVFRIIIRFAAFEPILNRIGDRNTAILGLLLFVLTFFGLIFVSDWIQYMFVLIVGSFAATCARGTMNSFISRSVSKFKQGRVQGLANSLEKIAEILGPAIGGSILASAGGAWFGFLLFSISCVPFAMSFKKLTFLTEGGSPVQAKSE